MRLLKLLLLFFLINPTWSQNLSFAMEQVGAEAFIAAGLNGEGVKIGIIDGGFMDADERETLGHHFAEDRVRFYRDYVTPDLEPYGGSRHQDDNHGVNVWEQIGGYDRENDVLSGLATEASYYLARTDHYAFERRSEEEFIIDALNDMIEQGVRLFNISLGYTNGYGRKYEDYNPQMMDGESTWITRAVDSVLANHDVLVVISAGNEGNIAWRTLSAPADSRNVLTVGAVKLNVLEEMDYSSEGSTAVNYVKPDVSAFSTTGTSFSAPVVTGIAACIMQYDPTLSAAEVKELIIRASSAYNHPNNYFGHGVPSLSRILELLSGSSELTAERVTSRGKLVRIPLDREGVVRSIIYHKDGWKVVDKQVVRSRRRVLVRRVEGCDRATIVTPGEELLEVMWR